MNARFYDKAGLKWRVRKTRVLQKPTKTFDVLMRGFEMLERAESRQSPRVFRNDRFC
jgi:hypothetical protein